MAKKKAVKKAASKARKTKRKAVKKKAAAKKKAKPAKRPKGSRRVSTKKDSPATAAKAGPEERSGRTNGPAARAELEAAYELSRILELYHQQIPVLEIARRLDKAPRTVSEALRRHRVKWAQWNRDRFAEIAAECAERELLIMRLCFEGYHASKAEKTVTATQSDNPSITERVHEAGGNPAFLATAERCNYRIGQLYGLFEKDKSENNDSAEVKTALIEVVVKQRGDLEEIDRIRQMSTDELRREIVPISEGVELLTT